MELEKLSDNWLFQQHSKDTIKHWLQQLRYFYFKRAWGGQANDGDEFQTAFTYTDRKDLIIKLGQLGLTLNAIPEDFPRPVVGKSYPVAEFEKFKNEIKKFPDLEQPEYSTIFGHKFFIWITENSIKMAVSGTESDNPYEVTEADFKVCLELEKHFDKLGWQNSIDKSLEKSVCCISETKYPELYAGKTSMPNNSLQKSGQRWWQRIFSLE